MSPNRSYLSMSSICLLPSFLLFSLVLSFGPLSTPAVAQSEAEVAEDEASDSTSETKGEVEAAAASKEDPKTAAEVTVSSPAKAAVPAASSGMPKTDAQARSGPEQPGLEPADGPADWPPGKPPGPGPQGWPEGKTAADFDNPDKEGPGGPDGWLPEDGIGVACQDYIDCVCIMADRTEGKTIGGYNHSGTCAVAKTYTTPDYEPLCAEELDQLKDALEDAKEDYKAQGIKLPPSCQ